MKCPCVGPRPPDCVHATKNTRKLALTNGVPVLAVKKSGGASEEIYHTFPDGLPKPRGARNTMGCRPSLQGQKSSSKLQGVFLSTPGLEGCTSRSFKLQVLRILHQTQLRGVDKTLWDRLTEESGTPEETAEVVVKLGLAPEVDSST